MPIPKPGKNETQDEFIARCMGDKVMNQEYPDQKQRSGVCYTQWEEKMQRGDGQGQGNNPQNAGGIDYCYCTKCNYKVKHDRGKPCNEMKCPECGAEMTGVKPKEKMKLETVNIGDVEIFEVGKWKGEEYTTEDLDQMVNNFKEKVAEPYITIDHSLKATSQFKDALKALALGFVDKLERQGTKLKAWFKQVPKTIANLIEAGALKKKSIEFYSDFIANGKLYNNVLQGVTFHGANGLPEVNTLSDFLSLYKSNLQTMDNKPNGIVSIENKDKEEKNFMEKIELKQDEYNDLLKKVSHVDVVSNENADLKKSMAQMKADNEKIQSESVEIKKRLDDFEKTQKETLKKEADNYISKQINDGKIKAAHKDRYVDEYVMYKADEIKFKSFIDDIESRGTIINFSPVTGTATNGDITNFKYDPESLDYKAGATINYNELESKIQAVMKADGCSWADAAKKCNVVHEDELGKGGE